MSEVVDKGYIPKKEKGSGEFKELYLEGVELLQKLSGAQWTDYNEHDPGVTILENVAYAMTNLWYKTSLPINDILTESKGSQLKSGDNGLFVPSDILTINPVTINDYRKVFIDGVTNVRNVWISEQQKTLNGTCDDKNDNNLKGLYHIYVEVYNYYSETEKQQKEEERIIHEVRLLFHEHRNLCEDIYDVTILKPYYLKMKLNVVLNDFSKSEEIMANIYYRICDTLTHEIRFYSLSQLQDQGVDVNTIFNGPLLKNGFIPDKELNKKLSCISISEMVKIIAKVKEVVRVDLFQISCQKENSNNTEFVPIKDSITIPNDYTPVLVFPAENTDFVIEHSDVKFHPDLSEVRKHLSYIESLHFGSFKSVSRSVNTIDIPEGQSLGLASYYPLRKQFPLNYGIGEYGLPNGLPAIRYAQSNQMKAYLLPFDQLMINFLAQLNHLYHIFDTKNNNLQSYFYQQLEDMPELVQLIKSNEYEDHQTALVNWNKTLTHLNAKHDTNFLIRLNEVADHLLARYGEYFATYSLKKIHLNCYGKELTEKIFQEDLLQWKRTLVSNYGQLSYNKAKAYNYKQGILDTNVLEWDRSVIDTITPGIIQKVAILMGIKYYKNHSLYKQVINSGIKIYQKKDGEEFIRERLELIYSRSNKEVVGVECFIVIDETIVNLRDSLYFSGNSATILKDVLREGLLESNYQIIPSSNKKKESYFVLFMGSKFANVVHISNTLENAQKAIDYSVKFLIDLNEKCEGLYLIEHLLLAPPYHGNYFGFTFFVPLKNGKFIWFNQAKLQSNSDRNNSVKHILNNLDRKEALQFQVLIKDNQYTLQILLDNGVALAESCHAYKTKEEAKLNLKALALQIETLEKGNFAEKVTYYAYYGNNRVDEKFFSFRMSIIMPSWPVRFQDVNFRTKMDNLLYEQVPINIVFQTFWLDFMMLADFEDSYYKWLPYISNNDCVEEQMSYAYQLITYIQQYQHLYNH